MDQYIGSNKLTTYLHPNAIDPFELKTESKNETTPTTATDGSNLIDMCVLNSFYQQLVDKPPVNTSPTKSLLPTSNVRIQMPRITHVSYPNTGDNHFKTKNSKSTPRVKLAKKCSSDQCVSDELPKVISDKRQRLSSTQQKEDDIISGYQLSNFIIKIEQLPSVWALNYLNRKSIPENDADEKILQMINEPMGSSPASNHLLASPSRSYESDSLSSIQSPRSDTTDRRNNNKSPQYRPRHSYLPSSETKSISSNSSKRISGNHRQKSSKTVRQLCRSPVFVRRPSKLFDTPDFDSTLQPIALLSLETNESTASGNHVPTIGDPPPSINANKRRLESSSSEQILIKRRHQKTFPILVIQRQYCISYPADIHRCVDCQTIKSFDLIKHQTDCRFQHCRILRYLGDEKYAIEGFTTMDRARPSDLEYLLIPDSGGQPPLSPSNANYIFTKIANFFRLLFSHEEAERKIQNEKEIIWKRYMAGWREVCDECSTTLFNYHYMCKICGYMICIECSNEFSQMNSDKRKRLKRICTHENSYCLSEFIPWNILIKLRTQCMNYLSKLSLDYSIKLYHTTRNENLSIFIKSLKMKRLNDKGDVQKIWSTIDCNFDPHIEFYCNGRLPVFNEWTSSNAKHFFQRVWSASCPVLVKQVHRNLSKTLWHPNAFKAHMIDHHETPALWDCETLVPIPTNETILTQFWDGFERLNIRLKNGERTRILKLKDWPTKKDFVSVFPTRLHDLMTNIPFCDYTRRSYVYNGVAYHGGAFNIVERLPPCLVKPDLGPKLYIAYSQLTSQASRKAGTTNLHIDVSDAVNVLVYVGIGGHGDDGSDKKEEIRQVEAEIFNSNIDEAQLQRLRNGEQPGALWHLFRADDAKQIREYLNRTQRKTPGSDAIHDQTAYLEKEDLNNLKEWSQVESYPILQFLGDAVFIPSGAPHQVKNLHSCIKIAEDFVSPENLDRCLITTNEFRSLSKTHTNHADILQAKNVLYYAARDALNSLNQSSSF